jgi:hypothetical protein
MYSSSAVVVYLHISFSFVSSFMGYQLNVKFLYVVK